MDEVIRHSQMTMSPSAWKIRSSAAPRDVKNEICEVHTRRVFLLPAVDADGVLTSSVQSAPPVVDESVTLCREVRNVLPAQDREPVTGFRCLEPFPSCWSPRAAATPTKSSFRAAATAPSPSRCKHSSRRPVNSPAPTRAWAVWVWTAPRDPSSALHRVPDRAPRGRRWVHAKLVGAADGGHERAAAQDLVQQRGCASIGRRNGITSTGATLGATRRAGWVSRTARCCSRVWDPAPENSNPLHIRSPDLLPRIAATVFRYLGDAHGVSR